MTTVFMLFTIQGLLGGFDNLWHHELQARLPQQPGARTELALHSARELLYGVIFCGIAWWQWNGAFAWLLGALLLVELVITLWDFVEEDRSRALPALERVLHTLLAINMGAILAVWSPLLLQWAQLPSALQPVSYGAWSWLMTAFGAGVFAWGIRNLFAVARLGVPQWQRDPMRAGASASGREVLVTGATGFIGRALVRALVERGERVLVLSRNAAKARDQFGPHVAVIDDLDAIDGSRRIDTIFNLAGESLAAGPWTAARRRAFFDSRVGTTRRLVALIDRLEQRPEVLVNGSAIGFYGETGNARVDENSAAGSGVLAELCCAWEQAAMQAKSRGVRVCLMRIGLVLGPGGGVLQPLALSARFGAASVLGTGGQWQSWIHRDDLVRLLLHAIDRTDLHGPINAVAPGAVTQRVFAHTLASTLHRPLWLRVPEIMLRKLAGDMSELFLLSQNVAPTAALASGFTFEHPQLAGALESVLLTPAVQSRAARPLAVYANDDCPVCHFEMDRYRDRASRAGAGITFCSVRRDFSGLPAYGLTAADLQARFFVYTDDGRLRSGMDAMIATWRALPGFGVLAALCSAPGVYALVNLLYDLVIAPGLTRWNARRLRLSTPAPSPDEAKR